MPITNVQLPPKDLRDAVLRERQDDKIKHQAALFESLFGGEEPSNTAKRNILEGELVMGSDCLYEAIRNIPRGATLIEGMNVKRTSMEAYIVSKTTEQE